MHGGRSGEETEVGWLDCGMAGRQHDVPWPAVPPAATKKVLAIRPLFKPSSSSPPPILGHHRSAVGVSVSGLVLTLPQSSSASRMASRSSPPVRSRAARRRPPSPSPPSTPTPTARRTALVARQRPTVPSRPRRPRSAPALSASALARSSASSPPCRPCNPAPRL
jgi:hypothetical protein